MSVFALYLIAALATALMAGFFWSFSAVIMDGLRLLPSQEGMRAMQAINSALRERLVINSVVYAELSVAFDRLEEVDAFLAGTGIEVDGTPQTALFLAGKAFQTYRARGGAKSGVLPDFFIGAHAVVEGIGLLTRDVARYRSYFPSIVLITPGDA